MARALDSRAAPFLVFLLFVLLLSYEVLPGKGGVINYSDGAYTWPTGGFDYFSTWIASNTGFPFIAQSFAAFQFLPNALTEFLFHLGPKGDAYQSYVLYYAPLYACCLITFFLARRISASPVYAYFAASFLILNNFVLEQLLVWPVTYFYCLAGLLAQLYVLWAIYEEGASPAKVAASMLVSVLAHHPFLFAVHFALQVFFMAFICLRGRVSPGMALAIVAGSVAIQAYWLVPFLYNLVSSTVAETHRASGESAFVGYGYTIRYSTLFNLVNYPMALDPKINDAVHNDGQTLFNYLVVVVALGGVMSVLRRNSPRLPEILFFLSIYLFFFNLALGPNSEITGAAWLWAYANVPGFGYFRSFNRFQIVALMALLVLGGLLFGAIESRLKTPAVLLLIAANVASYGIFFSGTFNGMVPTTHVPREYYRANEKHFRVNDGKVILSVPHIPYETYTWAVNARNDITNPAMYFLFYFMNAPVIFNQYANMLDRQRPAYANVLAFYHQARPFDESDHEGVRKLGVTHVMVHKDRLDTLKRTDRIVPWERYRDEFAGNPRYVLREDNAYFTLFELAQPARLVSGEQVDFEPITQTKYQVTIRNLRDARQVRFGQSFHPGWKFYAAGPRSPAPEGAPTGMTKNRLFMRDIGRVTEQPVLAEGSHYEVDGFANAWMVDPAALRQSLPPDSYDVNADGSLDVRLQLYFRPQAFLTLGIALSLLIAVAGAMVLAVHWLGRGARGMRPRAA